MSDLLGHPALQGWGQNNWAFANGDMVSKEAYMSGKKPDWVNCIEDEIAELRTVIQNITTLKKYVKYLLLDDPVLAPPESDLLALVPYDEPFYITETMPLLSNAQQVQQYQATPALMTGSKTIMQRKNRFVFGIPVSEGEMANLREQITKLSHEVGALTTNKNNLIEQNARQAAEITKLSIDNGALVERNTSVNELSAARLKDLEKMVSELREATHKLEEYREHERTPLIRDVQIAPIPVEMETPEPEKIPVVVEDYDHYSHHEGKDTVGF